MIACIDLKSFYASCECVARDLDPFKTPLVVCNTKHGDGAIVLAVSPYLKQLGVKSRCRLRDLPKDLEIIYAKPRMQLYLDKSIEIVNIYFKYLSQEDVFVYSIDEVFIDLAPYLKLYNTNALKLVKALKNQIYQATKISCSVGIGPNMLIAKVAMDVESKQLQDSIAIWSYEDIEKKLWNIKEMTDVWGIGKGMKQQLKNIGITSLKQLANTDLSYLINKFGKTGEKLYNIANGIDDTVIAKDIKNHLPKSFGKAQMLDHDTNSMHANLLIKEMLEELIIKLKLNNFLARTIHVFVKYSFSASEFSFAKRVSIDYGSDDLNVFVKLVEELLVKHLVKAPIRQVGVTLTSLESKDNVQLSLFNDYEKHDLINDAFVDIKAKYGKSSLVYATALLDESTILSRNKLIGGHNGGFEDE